MKFMASRKAVITDTKQIEAFLSRGLENVFPSKESFAKALASGRRLSIYLGVDPTGPTLHMGHAIPLRKLAELQRMGHKIILLIGDFTAMIGDPTDKGAARKQLTRKEVLDNCKLYKKQASKFLSFSGSNAAELKFNGAWLAKMTLEDVIGLASRVTVQQMLERDMFEKRMEEKKPIYLHEFLYPLMQGYDSVAMDVDAEIGGNDQTFNMLVGRDLMRSLKNKEKFVLATKLLVDPMGKKMGKSEGNMITMMDSAGDMFGKVMSWPDTMIVPGLELCTDVSVEAIVSERAFIEGGGNPRDAKLRLAHAVAALYHGAAAADKAQESFKAAFAGGSTAVMPSDAPEISVAAGSAVADALVSAKIVSSKSDFRRLSTEGAVKDIKTGAAVTFDQKIDADMDLKIGKHRFIKIRVK
ncbi:MAG TPA: tyrosine--tRNA ligase [Candidatus Paceibacterota bacterium]|nr:tyrosine--tRNA ligase [Candidatus Paceibacterota bacterium]